MHPISRLGCAALLLPWLVGTAAAAPLIHWASDPVAPGDTALLVGEHLDGGTTIGVTRLADDPEAAGPGADPISVPASRATATSLAFTLPDNLGAGVVRVTVATKDGEITRLLNAPSVYWLQGDNGATATPGGWIRAFGRDIARTLAATLRLSRDGTTTATLGVAAADLWDGRFAVPANLPAGRYDVSLWNGNGDSTAIAALGRFDIADRPPSSAPAEVTEIASTAEHTDDTARLNAALAGIGRTGGGIVHLTRGNYTVSATLEIPPNVTLQGAGIDATSIVLAESPNPPDAVISGRTTFSVRDLSIAAGTHRHIIRGGFDGDKPLAGAHDIVVDHIRIRASLYSGHLTPEDIKQRLVFAQGFGTGGPDAIRLSGERVTLTNSDILSSGRSLFLDRVRYGRIADNALFNGRYGWYSISASQNLIFETNSITGADMQSTGGGINTMSGSGDLGSMSILIEGNHFTRLMGWDREAMTSDGGGGCYAGPVSFQAGESTVRATAPSAETRFGNCRGGSLMIVDGAGRGIVRRILSADTTSASLDAPMPTTSDAASFGIVGATQRHYLIIGNTFEDTGALQLFGTSVDHVIAGNSFTRSDGIFLRALRYKELQPILYVQILGNHILDAPVGRQALIQVRTQPPADLAVPLIIAVIARDNALDLNGRIELRGSTNLRSAIADAVIEHNRVARTGLGISIDRSAPDALVRANAFTGVTVPLAGHTAP